MEMCANTKIKKANRLFGVILFLCCCLLILKYICYEY